VLTPRNPTSAFRQNAEMLEAEAVAIRELRADVLEASDIGTHAVEYAVRNWAVLPLRGKVPAIAGGRGVLDATTDIKIVVAWWGGHYAGCNIGARIPDSLFLLDVDPRNGGLKSLADLEHRNSPLPETMTHVSGRGDGGTHRFYRRPPGNLSDRRLGPGVDIKTSSGYAVVPPSIHPASGRPYTRIDAPVADPPAWLIGLLLPQRALSRAQPRPPSMRLSGDSVADRFSDSVSWDDILRPHGWRCLDADPDADGSRWLHPNATSSQSATVRYGCLFVYSTNTQFDTTLPADPHGYTRFRAYAVLNHEGDLSAAAHAISRRAAAS